MSNATAPKRLAFFERYLTLWVFLCIIAGVALGKLAPGLTATLSGVEFGEGSQVNVPIAVLIWLMIYPMMLKVDFTALGGIARKPKGLAVTLFVNWLVKPFSMALLAWVFMHTPSLRGFRRSWRRNTPPASSSWPLRHARRWSLCGATSPTATRSIRWCRWR